MSSAVKLVLGVSTLAMAVGFAACDNAGTEGGTAGAGVHPVGTAGTGSGTPGAGAPGQGGGSPGAGNGSVGGGSPGGGADASGVPLTPTDGWVDAMSNALGIQGAVITYADDTSTAGPPAMASILTGTQACISGVAALVDTTSVACTTKVFTPPATDCYGQYWGAAIALNLNQPNDTTVTPPMAGTAVPYDASNLVGFSFDITGDTVPAPKDIRFNVENGTQFCNIPTHKVLTGSNTFMFTDLVTACYKLTTPPDPPNPTAETIKSGVIKISWQVVTNTSNTVPFNFCISNIRAILKPGFTPPPLPTGGAAGVAGAAGSPASGGTGGSAGSSAGGTSGSAGAGGASAGNGGSGGSSGSAGKAGTAG